MGWTRAGSEERLTPAPKAEQSPLGFTFGHRRLVFAGNGGSGGRRLEGGSGMRGDAVVVAWGRLGRMMCCIRREGKGFL